MEMLDMQTTDLIDLAGKFVNSTNNHIFLTGKAGTGKTTFLQNLARQTHKKFVIVAPTGIAALNAGGVTIHSQFLLPHGSFLHTDIPGHADSPQFYTSKDLARRNPINSMRKQVLRDIELLIIDEISMVRADMLDAIDYRLRAVKGNYNKSFGGVQVLMIGDLYQLPPIVKDHEWEKLRKFYKSMHFFESQALQSDGFTYIELDKIFRQQDERFISILNNLRNNQITAANIDALNKYYDPNPHGQEGIVTLTTHNRQAEAINQSELDKLSSKAEGYDANISGDFPESMYPLSQKLSFKVGAQVMFVKNDNIDKRYYNGKLGRISKLETDHITVFLLDEERDLKIERVDWINKKYVVTEKSKELKEEIAGTFTQFPLKLAWAITIHKSQGLTFDRAIIDVGQAFAPGQVYVALSRLRSLEGLILKTKINPQSISCDREVQLFSGNQSNQDPANKKLKLEQHKYLSETLLSTFDFNPIAKQIQYTMEKGAGKSVFADEAMENAMPHLMAKIRSESETSSIFQKQISTLLLSGQSALLQRIEKGSAYYFDLLHEWLFVTLLQKAHVEMLSRTKTYANSLAEIDQLISAKIAEIQRAAHLTKCILEGSDITLLKTLKNKRLAKREAIILKIEAEIRQHPKTAASKSGRKKSGGATSKGKKALGETYGITLEFFKKGGDLQSIAKDRQLALGTIEGHFAQLISEGKIKVKEVVTEEQYDNMSKVLLNNTEKSLKDIHDSLKGAYSYSQIKMVRAHLDIEKTIS